MQEVAVQRSRGLVDRHLVVVEDDEDVRIGRGTRIVESLKGETSRECAIANDRNHMVLILLQLHGLGYAKGGRYAHRGVSCAEVVVLALGHAREATYATELAVGCKGIAATCYDFVGVSLVSHIPHDAVVGRVVDIVQRSGKLHRAEA